MKLMKNTSSNMEDNTKLQFLGNYKYDKSQYNVEEIFLGKAILLQKVRILKADANPHPKTKSMQR